MENREKRDGYSNYNALTVSASRNADNTAAMKQNKKLSSTLDRTARRTFVNMKVRNSRMK